MEKKYKVYTKIFIRAISIISILNFYCIGNTEEYNDADIFIEKAEYEYKIMVNLVDPLVINVWKERYNKVIHDCHKTGEILDLTEKLLKKEGKFDPSVFSYSYLKESNHVLLEGYTNLVNDMGKGIVAKTIEDKIDPVTKDIDRTIEQLPNTANLHNIMLLLSEYYRTKREIESIADKPNVKHNFTFTPKSSAYSTIPDLVKEYVIYDWVGSNSTMSSHRAQLLRIRDELKIKVKLAPKDPMPFLTISLQIAALLASLPGYMLTFAGQKHHHAFTVVILVSMAISIFLIFVNPSTILNVLIQCVVPGWFVFHNWRIHKKQENKTV